MSFPEEAPPSMKPDQPKPQTENEITENPGLEKMSKNPNPRANENLDDEDIKEGNTEGVGSEITDGEAG